MGEGSLYPKGRNPRTFSHLPLGLLLREDFFLYDRRTFSCLLLGLLLREDFFL
jgi:hypothetical protein